MLLQIAKCLNSPLTEVLVKDRLCHHASDRLVQAFRRDRLHAVPLGAALSSCGRVCLPVCGSPGVTSVFLVPDLSSLHVILISMENRKGKISSVLGPAQ